MATQNGNALDSHTDILGKLKERFPMWVFLSLARCVACTPPLATKTPSDVLAVPVVGQLLQFIRAMC
jgi:hypothetical protein